MRMGRTMVEYTGMPLELCDLVWLYASPFHDYMVSLVNELDSWQFEIRNRPVLVWWSLSQRRLSNCCEDPS